MAGTERSGRAGPPDDTAGPVTSPVAGAAPPPEPPGPVPPGGPAPDAGSEPPAAPVPPAAEATGLRSRLQVLRVPAFRWFFAGQAASSFGDFVVGPALAFAVLDLTGSAADIGLVLAARSVPVVAFMLFGGVLADRLPRHRVMIAADVARFAGQGTMAVLLLTGHARIWELMALQAVHGTASAMFTPAVSGLIRQTVPDGMRQAANALRGMSQSAAMIAGPLVATLLVVTAGSGWAVAADAATFAVSGWCLGRLDLPGGATPAGATGSMLRDLRDGWREFTSRTWVWSMILTASLTNMFYAFFGVLGPVFSARVLGGPGAWGTVLACFGAGAVLGGTLALYARPRRPLLFCVLVDAFFAAPTLVMSGSSSVVPVAAAAFAGGVGLMVFNPVWETVLQREVPPAALSRVSAYEWFGSYAGQPLGLALAGPIALRLGLRGALLTAGLAQLLISLTPLAVRDVRALTSARTPREE